MVSTFIKNNIRKVGNAHMVWNLKTKTPNTEYITEKNYLFLHIVNHTNFFWNESSVKSQLHVLVSVAAVYTWSILTNIVYKDPGQKEDGCVWMQKPPQTFCSLPKVNQMYTEC